MAHPDRVALALACHFSDPFDRRTWMRGNCPLTPEEFEVMDGFDCDDMEAVLSLTRTDLELVKAANLEGVRELGRLASAALQRLADDPSWPA